MNTDLHIEEAPFEFEEEETPFEELELTYRLAVALVAAVRDNIRVMALNHWLERIAEYGWIKPTDNKRSATGYIVTEKGQRVLCPRNPIAVNFTNDQPVPFAMTPDGQQVCIFMDVLASPTPFDVTTDGKQICLLSNYLDEMESPQPA